MNTSFLTWAKGQLAGDEWRRTDIERKNYDFGSGVRIAYELPGGRVIKVAGWMGLALKKRSGPWLLSWSMYTNGDPQSHLIIELFIQSKCSEKSLQFSPSGKFLKLYQQLFPIFSTME